MERYIIIGWIILGLVMCIIFGPIWIPILMIGLLLIWLYYKPKEDDFADYWRKWRGLFYLSGVLCCLFKFSVVVPIFILIGVAIDYWFK